MVLANRTAARDSETLRRTTGREGEGAVMRMMVVFGWFLISVGVASAQRNQPLPSVPPTVPLPPPVRLPVETTGPERPVNQGGHAVPGAEKPLEPTTPPMPGGEKNILP